MARIIDRFFFTAIAVTACYAAVLRFSGSVPLSMLAGFAAPFPLRALSHLVRRRFSDSHFCLKHSRRKRAEETVRVWSVLRDADCRNDILTLMRTAYPASARNLCLPDDAAEDAVPVHILMTLRPLSSDAMADVLRRIREGGHTRAAVVCTAEFTPEARALALIPEHSSVALLDGAMLSALLTKHPSAVPMRHLPPVRAPRVTLTRAHAMKMTPVLMFLLAMYHILGLDMYLPAAMALLWGMLMLLRRRRAPDLLFH